MKKIKFLLPLLCTALLSCQSLGDSQQAAGIKEGMPDIGTVAAVVKTVQSPVQIAQNYCENYFKQYGLLLKSPIYFKTMAEVNFPLENKSKLIGAYNTDDRTVYINSYADISEIQVFGQKMTEDWYVSYLVHEISHAYIRDNWNRKELDIPLQEYLVYSIQLGFINSTVRNHLFKQQPVDYNDDRDQIMPLHDYNPYRFAMYSYDHFTRQKKNYLQQVIGGQQ